MQARQIHALYVPMARRGDRGLAPLAHSTRRDVHTTLKMALKQAVRWRLMPQNPADLLNESAIAHFVAFSGKLSAVSKTNREDLRSAMGVKFVENGLTFDDVLIVPRRSSVYSRRDVSLRTRLVGDLTLELPIISANMDTVTELAMATAMAEAGGMGVIHRFVDDPETHADWVSSTPGHRFLAIGVKPADLEKIPMVEGLDGVVIDVAHGHSDRVAEMIAALREGYPNLWIVAGNVATAEGAWDLLEAGAHAIKVGVGPGAVCTTRIVTGCGVPQLTAVLKVRAAIDRWWDAERRKARPRVEHPPALIADGGIRNSGDIAKALVAGADTVMIGSLFAGTDEAPGAVIRENGQAFKLYRGMASQGAMDRVGSDRTPEGVSTLIPHKGSVRALVTQLEGGIRSALSYCNSASIADLHEQTIEMVKVSPASVRENSPHGLSLSPAQPQ